MESGIKKLRELGEEYLNLLVCFKCKGKIVGFCGFDSYCRPCLDELENGEVLVFCENCRTQCKSCRKTVESKSVRLELVSEFFRVSCEKHGERVASRVLDQYLTPLCEKCCERCEGITKPIVYKEVEKLFVQLYSENRMRILSDRKKNLMSRSLGGLLKATQWLFMLVNGFPCDAHKSVPAEYVDNNFKLYCAECNKNSNSHPLSSLTKTGNLLREPLKQAVKTADSSSINKFLIGLAKINSQFEVKKPLDLNLLILEGKDFFNSVFKYQTRCVECMCKLTIELKKGVQLKCGHFLCFKCIFYSNIQQCPFDNQKIAFNLYLNPTFTLPSCHKVHSFSPSDKIHKLPCQHFTCESHLSEKYCFDCGLDKNFCGIQPKLSQNCQNLIKSYKPQCQIHSKPYSYFSLLQLIFLCEDCLKLRNCRNVFKFDSDNTEFLERLIEDLYSRFTNKIKEDSTLSVWFLKVFSYLGLKGFQFKINFLTCVRLLYADPLLKHEKLPCVPAKIFDKQANPYRDIIKVSGDLVLTFTVMPYHDFIVAGVLFNPCFFESKTFGVTEFIESCEVKVYSKDRVEYPELKLEMDEIVIDNIDGENALSASCRPFVARMDYVYAFIYKLRPEFQYFRSVASSKLLSHLFKVGKYWIAPNSSCNVDGNLGGMLYGLQVDSLDYLF